MSPLDSLPDSVSVSVRLIRKISTTGNVFNDGSLSLLRTLTYKTLTVINHYRGTLWHKFIIAWSIEIDNDSCWSLLGTL